MHFFCTVNDYPDPHDPTIEWYIHPEGDVDPFRDQELIRTEVPETPERLALWIAIKLIGHRWE